MILEHDPQLARTIYNTVRPDATPAAFSKWLDEAEELARGLGYELRGRPRKNSKRPPMVIISVKVPPVVKEKLILLSEKTGLSLSEVARQALIRYLKDEGVIP